MEKPKQAVEKTRILKIIKPASLIGIKVKINIKIWLTFVGDKIDLKRCCDGRLKNSKTKNSKS